MNGEDRDEPGGMIGLGDIMGIVWRRRLWIAAPFVLGLIAAVAAAFLLPSMYRSSSTLLIESPQIPTSLVASPFSSYADERIAKIRQQIVSRSQLLELIRDNQLYAGEQAALPLDAVLAKMRDAIRVDLVSASASNAANRGANTTIAFTLSYDYADPRRAHQVASQLTQMFIVEDKRLRTEQASGAADFLQNRADELRDRLIEIENKRRSIQARYAGALPDQAALSAQGAAALRSELSRLDAETQSIMQQNNLLAARSQDTIALVEPPGRAEVRQARQTLNRLTATLSDSHPDVVAAREALEIAQAAAGAEPVRPAMSAITSEIQAGRARIASLGARRGQLLAAIASAERMIAQSPQAAYELNNLERETENLQQQYVAIRDKQLEAQVAANMQSEDKGERFSIVDPPTMPTEPVSPKRLQIVLMGAVGGLALGFGLTLLFELIAGAIHGAGAVTRLTGEAPLATIPIFKAGPLPQTMSWLDRLLPWRRHQFALIE